MKLSCLFHIFFLCVTLFFSVSRQAESVSDVYHDKNEGTSNTTANDSKNTRQLSFVNSSEQCNCGNASTGCRYNDGKKTCFCISGYAQKRDTCEECNCGFDSTGCSFVYGKKVCDCRFGYGENNGKCQGCDCGVESTGCSFKKGDKTCYCNRGTSQKGGKCEECYCGIYSEDCHFEKDRKVCSCIKNYKQNFKDECEECDCGLNSHSCSFNGHAKSCHCIKKHIYVASSGRCEKCDCGEKAESCELTSDKYTRCKCEYGFIAERTKPDMDEKCDSGRPWPTGWRVATYIESVIFGIIILTCLFKICYKSDHVLSFFRSTSFSEARNMLIILFFQLYSNLFRK